MSSIDAAIIKALVEHIGGNPDEIPDGAIGEGGGDEYKIYDQITITINDKVKLSSSIPLFYLIRHGHIIRLKTTTGETIDYICKSITDGMYGFGTVDGTSSASCNIDSSSTEVSINLKYSNADFEAPDNVSTGYMIPQSIIGSALVGLSSNYFSLLDKIKALESSS